MTKTTSTLGARAEQAAHLLATLANPQRLLILCHLLRHGETGAGALAAQFGFGPSALSQHLARMRAESLIVQRRAGRALFYSLNGELTPHLPALLDSLCAPDGQTTATPQALRGAAIGVAFGAALGPEDEAAWQNPLVRGAGRIHPLPHAAYQPDPDATCKVVFSLTRGCDDAHQIHPALQRVARTLNLYAGCGVPLERLKLVAVAAGAASTIAFDDALYAEQFGVANPNLPLIRELRGYGVDIAVCGQAVVQHHAQGRISRDVTLALSALTTITTLEQKGYALLPL